MRLWSSGLMRPSLARMRLRIVLRRTANRPRLFFPLMWVRPRKSKRSGFPSSLPLRFSSANPEFDDHHFAFRPLLAPDVHPEIVSVLELRRAVALLKLLSFRR